MLVTDPSVIRTLLSSHCAKAEALDIIDDTRARPGETPRFGMMRYASSPTTQGWILVSQETACRYADILNKDGLTRDQVRELLGVVEETPTEVAPVEAPRKRCRPKGSKNKPKADERYNLNYARQLKAERNNAS